MGTEPTTDESASAPGVGARRARPGRSGRAGEARLFVLDTSVLMHDPTALFRFGAHDVYLPMAVLEEMDAAKKGVSEIARNVREVSRILDGIIRAADQTPIEQGFPLPGATGEAAAGRLYFQTRDCSDPLPDVVPGSHADNGILNVARMLHRERPGRAVVIVSKDINLRIKARALGMPAEDYQDDVVLDDVSASLPGRVRAGERIVESTHWCWCGAFPGEGRPDARRRQRRGDPPAGSPTSACTRPTLPARACSCAGPGTEKRWSSRPGTTAPAATPCGG